jgi:predicted transcriptional regulator
MTKAPPEVTEIEELAQSASIDMGAVLKKAGVATTTWWRWGEGHFEPRIKTLRRVREALDAEIAARDAA